MLRFFANVVGDKRRPLFRTATDEQSLQNAGPMDSVRKRETEEQLQYELFLSASPMGRSIRQLLVDLEQASSHSTYVFPVSPHAAIERELQKHMREASPSAQAPLPSRFVVLLMQRLGGACASLSDVELVEFLSSSLPGLLLVFTAHETSARLLAELGLEQHLCSVLAFVTKRLGDRSYVARQKQQSTMLSLIGASDRPGESDEVVRGKWNTTLGDASHTDLESCSFLPEPGRDLEALASEESLRTESAAEVTRLMVQRDERPSLLRTLRTALSLLALLQKHRRSAEYAREQQAPVGDTLAGAARVVAEEQLWRYAVPSAAFEWGPYYHPCNVRVEDMSVGAPSTTIARQADDSSPSAPPQTVEEKEGVMQPIRERGGAAVSSSGSSATMTSERSWRAPGVPQQPASQHHRSIDRCCVQEAVRLFFLLSKGSLDSERPQGDTSEGSTDEDDELVAEIVCELAYLILALFCVDDAAAYGANIDVVIAGIGVLVARLLVLEDDVGVGTAAAAPLKGACGGDGCGDDAQRCGSSSPTPSSLGDAGTASRATSQVRLRLIRQLAASLLLSAGFLKRFSLVAAAAMNSVNLFERLVSVLQTVGKYYGSASLCEQGVPITAQCEQQLASFIDARMFPAHEGLQRCELRRPKYELLSCHQGADDFLRSFATLVDVARSVRSQPHVLRETWTLAHLNDLEVVAVRAALGLTEPLRPASCLGPLVLKVAIASLPHGDPIVAETGRFRAFRRLVAAGLYNALFHHKHCLEFRRDPTLQLGALYILNYMLTRASLIAEEDNGLEEEVGAAIDTLLHDNYDEADHINLEIVPMCAVLLSGLSGSSTSAVAAAVMQCNGIPTLATAINKLAAHRRLSVANDLSGALSAGSLRALTASTSSTLGRRADALHWVVLVLQRLFSQHEVQVFVLKSEPSIVLSLLAITEVRTEVECMLVSLLTHQCSEVDYSGRMVLMAKAWWEAVGRYEQLTLGRGAGRAERVSRHEPTSDVVEKTTHVADFAGGVAAATGTNSSPGASPTDATCDGQLRPPRTADAEEVPVPLISRGLGHPAVSGIEDEEADRMLLSLLRSMRVALARLQPAERGMLWGPLRLLQNVICSPSVKADCFRQLMERCTIPWKSVRPHNGVASVLATINALTKGNPVLRQRLAQSVSSDEMVEALSAVWLLASPNWPTMMRFAQLILAFVYEVDTPEGALGLCDADEDGVSHSTVYCEAEAHSNLESMPVEIEKAALLKPLLRLFVVRELNDDRHRTLQHVVSRVTTSCRESRASLWRMASDGIFDVLTDLLPVVHGTALLEEVQSLMVLVATHHVDVRQLKRFLTSTLQSGDSESRRRFLPVVIEVMNEASYAFLKRRHEPAAYIAFLARNGPSGIRVTLGEEFPVDGYTVSLWLRMESGHQRRQCIFSLQNEDQRTVLELIYNKTRLSVVFQDAQRRTAEVDLGCNMAPHSWTHLAVSHRQAALLFTEVELQLFLNGVEVTMTNRVGYPQMLRGQFFVATRGEDIEQRSNTSSLVGQVNGVFFFRYPLTSREVRDLAGLPAAADGDAGATALLGADGPSATPHRAVSRQMTERAMVCIDPRLSEQGRLYNLAAVMRGRPRESPLVTYEGTITCRVSSIIDAVCVVGALQTVIMPLTAMLVNPDLPFTTDFMSVSSSRSIITTASDTPFRDILKLTETLLTVKVVRVEVVRSGFFWLLSNVLRRLGAYLTTDIPQRLASMCVALLQDAVIFDNAFTQLFLVNEIFHACAPSTQLVFVTAQRVICSVNAPLRERVRMLGLQAYVAHEITTAFNAASEHHRAMRKQLFLLLETVVAEPFTSSDADAILSIVWYVVKRMEEAGDPADVRADDVALDILWHVRALLVSRSPWLCELLGKRDVVGLFLPLLSYGDVRVRSEAIMLLALLMCRSRRTQELLNPKLGVARDAVHVEHDVSLSFLKEKLQRFPVDQDVYLAFRNAIVGSFTEQTTHYVRLKSTDSVALAPMLIPLLQLVKRAPQRVLRQLAVDDICAMLLLDSTAWKRVILLPGWYLYLSDVILVDDESVAHVDDELVAGCASVFVQILHPALAHEVYGASELEMVISYLSQSQTGQGLLTKILVGLIEEFHLRLLKRGGASSATVVAITTSATLNPFSNVALANLTALLYAIEDVVFYGATTALACSKPKEWDALKRGYDEALELKYLNPEEDSHIVSKDPDGRWAHLTLAIRTMDLLTSHAFLVNSAGMQAPRPIEGAPCNRQHRKGGYQRLCIRLLTTTCQMTLREPSSLNAILSIAHRFIELLERENATGFLLTRREATNEVRDRATLPNSMKLFLALHSLLLRRLQSGEDGATDSHINVNEQLLERAKHIIQVNYRHLQEIEAFQGSSEGTGSWNRHCRQETLPWMADRTKLDVTRGFVEVASRPDYCVFVERCMLVQEKSKQNVDKPLYREIALAHIAVANRLHALITTLSVVRQNQLEVVGALIESVRRNCAQADEGAFFPASQAAAKLSHAAFSGMWAKFIERCKGTIWDADPDGSRYVKFVKLHLLQQQPLVRRKLVRDPNGTGQRSVPVFTREAKRGEQHISADGASGTPMLPPRIRGGEDVILRASSFKELDDDDASAASPPVIPASPSNVDDGCGKEQQPGDAAVSPSKSSAQTTAPAVAVADEDDTSSRSAEFVACCELAFMMHCWSASLLIKGQMLSIIVDDENKGYNQTVAAGALAFVQRPKDVTMDIAALARVAPGRRFRMRRTALELWASDGRSVFVNFPTVAEMRAAVQRIRALAEKLKRPYAVFQVLSENPKKELVRSRWIEQWRNREITNFDYLLVLNLLAGRTVNDVTQYPVFPWVLADYKSATLDLDNPVVYRDLSLPIGICGDPSRRGDVQRRYQEMKMLGDVPSHYFTHYSSPAVAIYFLVRVEPFTALQILLQGGHFDHADRMFHSIAATWSGVTKNTQDVRELIPEMYYLPEICFNSNRVRFGTKQDGCGMDDLQLPPWAMGDPYLFIYYMRAALESDHVSATLHRWIDLIFGYKQRGKEAIDAVNVFNWYSYEDQQSSRGWSAVTSGVSGNSTAEALSSGPSASAKDPAQQLLIDSLDNIGQTPIQLFTKKHPERRANDVLDPASTDSMISVKTMEAHWFFSRIARVTVLATDRVVLIGGNGAAVSLRMSSTVVRKRDAVAVSRTIVLSLEAVRGVNRGPVSSLDIGEDYEYRLPPLPAGVVPNTASLAGGPCVEDTVAVLSIESEIYVVYGGLFDNSCVIRCLTSNVEDTRLLAHRGRVMCVASSCDSRYLVTSAEDTTFIVWACHHYRGKLIVDLSFTICGHEDNPTAIGIDTNLDIVATGSRDGVIMLHSLQNPRLEHSLRHPEKRSVDSILIPATCYVPTILIVSRSDSVIHQISLNGVHLRSCKLPRNFMSWCATPLQYFLVSCGSGRSGTPPVGETIGAEAALEVDSTVVFMHSLLLTILKTVAVEDEARNLSASCSIACHPQNAQAMLCTAGNATLQLLRTELSPLPPNAASRSASPATDLSGITENDSERPSGNPSIAR